VAGHDPANVALGRLAIERGVLDRARALALLERATREGCGLVDVARREPALVSIVGALEALAPATPSAGPRALKPGARFAQHTLEKTLGQGGMGAVFLGRDDAGALHAIKVPTFSDNPLDNDDERARFTREAQSVARMPPHRNVVRVHAAGLEGDAPYLVLELVTGTGLDKLLEKGPLPVERALEIGEKLASALEHVHRHGIVHRDMKPANVLVRAEDGSPVLTDFGLASDAAARERLTKTGTTLGTPQYMPPEQTRLTSPADARSDVYSLGATIYHAVAGQPPFTGETLTNLLVKINMAPAPPPSRVVPGISPDVDAVLLKALEKLPADRYATAHALGEDLGRARRGEPVAARPVTRAERLKREMKRRPGWFFFRVAVLIAVVAGGVSAVAIRRIRAERQAVERKNALEWQERLDKKRIDLESLRRGYDNARLGAELDRGKLERYAKELADAFRQVDELLRAVPDGATPDVLDEERGLVQWLRVLVEHDRAILEAHAAISSGDLKRARARAGEAASASAEWARLENAVLEARLAAAEAHDPPSLDAAIALVTSADAALKRANLPESRRLTTALGARLRASFDPGEFERRAPECANFLAALSSEPALSRGFALPTTALPEFIAAACSGSRGATGSVVAKLAVEERRRVAHAVAQVDREDKLYDRIAALPVEELSSFFEELADAALEAGIAESDDDAARLIGQAIRGNPLVAAKVGPLQSLLKIHSSDALRTKREKEALEFWIDSARLGFDAVNWTGTESVDWMQSVEARHGERPKDWAVTQCLLVAQERRIRRLNYEITELHAGPGDERVIEKLAARSKVCKRIIELSSEILAAPEHLPLATVALAHYFAAGAWWEIHELKKALAEYQTSERDLAEAPGANQGKARTARDLWVAEKDRKWLDLAVESSIRVLHETRARAALTELVPFGDRKVPLARMDPPDDNEKHTLDDIIVPGEVMPYYELNVPEAALPVLDAAREDKLPHETCYRAFILFVLQRNDDAEREVSRLIDHDDAPELESLEALLSKEPRARERVAALRAARRR
jgi:hypothetical protein